MYAEYWDEKYIKIKITAIDNTVEVRMTTYEEWPHQVGEYRYKQSLKEC